MIDENIFDDEELLDIDNPCDTCERWEECVEAEKSLCMESINTPSEGKNENY